MFATAAEILSLTPGSRCLYFMISLLPLGQWTEREWGEWGCGGEGGGRGQNVFRLTEKVSAPKLNLEIRFVA